jgi:hypothetical protein
MFLLAHHSWNWINFSSSSAGRHYHYCILTAMPLFFESRSVNHIFDVLLFAAARSEWTDNGKVPRINFIGSTPLKGSDFLFFCHAQIYHNTAITWLSEHACYWQWSNKVTNVMKSLPLRNTTARSQAASYRWQDRVIWFISSSLSWGSSLLAVV